MKYQDQLRIWESDYGRSEGWDLELDGEIVGLLDDPQSADMFWDSYRLTVTTDDPMLKERLLSTEFWKYGDCLSLVCRSRATGLLAAYVLPAPGFNQFNRIEMRGLYILLRGPAPWDWIVLKGRALLRWILRSRTTFAK